MKGLRRMAAYVKMFLDDRSGRFAGSLTRNEHIGCQKKLIK